MNRPGSPAAGRPAVFVDRDGTINVEVNYLHRPADFEFIPGAPEAIGHLNRAGWLVIVVTNQAGIARGYYDVAALRRLHAHLQTLLGEHGAHVDAFYWCPHHPEFTGTCDCRKPAPGMLYTAAADLGIDLQRSWLIGDSAGDLGAARAAGCRAILVRTGYGAALEAQLRRQPAPVDRPEAIVDGLPQAVEYLLAAENKDLVSAPQ